MAYSIHCERCGQPLKPGEPTYACPGCGSPLAIIYDYDALRGRLSRAGIEGRPPGVWRYRELLPVADNTRIVTLDEGATRLHRCGRLGDMLGLGDSGLYVKDETGNPTGTHKDRPATVAITKAVEFGARMVAVASDGNTGPSVAAYAAKAGLPCYAFMPRSTPSERLVQVQMYGAAVITIQGSVNECIDLVERGRERFGWHHMSTASPVNPYQREGAKTIAYEICEQLGWHVPDWVAAPVGGGGALAAIWQGFKEFHLLGLVDRLPRMLAVQAAGCAPLVRAFDASAPPGEIRRWEAPSTIALTIAVPFPLDGESALKAVYESNGHAIAVSDPEILSATRDLAASEGILAEPTGAASVAGAGRAVSLGIIAGDESVVCVVTGTGLKTLGQFASEYGIGGSAGDASTPPVESSRIAGGARSRCDREVMEWAELVLASDRG